jgi:hypothetical protein
VIKPGVAVRSSGVLDVDIPVVRITGKVTLGGKVAPDADDHRGFLTFAEKSGGSAKTTSFDSTGAITYALRVLPGKYILTYAGNTQLCQNGVSPFPCQSVSVAGCE